MNAYLFISYSGKNILIKPEKNKGCRQFNKTYVSGELLTSLVNYWYILLLFNLRLCIFSTTDLFCFVFFFFVLFYFYSSFWDFFLFRYDWIVPCQWEFKFILCLNLNNSYHKMAINSALSKLKISIRGNIELQSIYIYFLHFSSTLNVRFSENIIDTFIRYFSKFSF